VVGVVVELVVASGGGMLVVLSGGSLVGTPAAGEGDADTVVEVGGPSTSRTGVNGVMVGGTSAAGDDLSANAVTAAPPLTAMAAADPTITNFQLRTSSIPRSPTHTLHVDR
jgi:hypothetical protein